MVGLMTLNHMFWENCMIKLGTMSLNVRNTTATEFAGIVSDLGLDVIEYTQVRLNRQILIILGI